VPGKLKLTTADIGALIEARHPEPRSLLGYHEVRRGKAEPRSVVRVLELVRIAEIIPIESSLEAAFARLGTDCLDGSAGG